MKRFAVLFLACTILIPLILAGCDKLREAPIDPTDNQVKSKEDTDNEITPATDASDDKVINVFSLSDETPNMITEYRKLHPDFPYRINVYCFATVDGDYHVALDECLAEGSDVIPDIYCVESGKVPKYSQGSKAMYAIPYKELGIDIDRLLIEADIPQYIIDMGSNPEGEVVALAYQGTGSAFIYRRSIAKDVWGTDDPEVIKDKIGPGWTKFFLAAEKLKAKGYGIVSGADDIWRSVENSAQTPWVIDGRLNIDPKREKFLDLAKELVDKGYSNNTIEWTDDWYADMRGDGEKQIFGFFGPSWLVNYVLIHNCGGKTVGEGTYGDWAVCEPPEGFFWSGTWVYVNKNSKHKDAIADIIKWLTLDSTETGLQYLWANGFWANGIYYDKKYEAVASGAVMRKSSAKHDLIGYQNMFEVFDKAAGLANGKNRTEYDDIISLYWREQVREYTAGNKTRAQAIEDFKQKVKEKLNIEIE